MVISKKGKKQQNQANRGRNSSFWRRWLTRQLIARLQTKSVEMRTYILQTLGKVGDESALPVLLDAARDSDINIRRFAVSALADFRSVDALIAALKDSESDIRATAAMSLGLLRDKSAENALMELLSDNDVSVRSQAVIALGHLRSNYALPMLNQMISTESNEWMRRYISQAIREIEGGIYS